MTNDALRNKFCERGLLPFQADFAVRVLTEQSSSLLLLHGPVGSGTTHTICHAVAEGIGSGTFKRVLCLTSTGLAYGMRDKLRGLIAGIPVECADRKFLSNFETSASSDAHIWPEQGVFVAALEFAKRPEMSPIFVDGEWDIVIIDEAHRVANATASQEFVKSLIGKYNTHVVFVSHLSIRELEEVIAQLGTSQTLAKVVWEPFELRNCGGDYAFQKETIWEIVRYHMNESEAAFYETFEMTAEVVSRFVRGNSLLQQSLMKRATSCLYSVEGALIRQRSRIRKYRDELVLGVQSEAMQRTHFESDEDDSRLEIFDKTPEQVAGFLSGYEHVMRLIDDTLTRLEVLETDSKSEEAIRVLRQLPVTDNICVLSQYEETVSYLNTVFEEETGMQPITLSSKLFGDEIERRLAHYRSRGGLLLASDAGLGGFDFLNVDTVLHYDLPNSPARLAFRIGRFNQIGRQGILRMIAIVEENAVTAKVWDKVLAMVENLGLNDWK